MPEKSHLFKNNAHGSCVLDVVYSIQCMYYGHSNFWVNVLCDGSLCAAGLCCVQV